MMERRRRQARTIAVVVAVAMVGVLAIPFFSMFA